MGVGTGKSHVLGRNQKFYAASETTQGTFMRPASTDAVKTQQSSMKHEQADDPIDDNSDYRYDTESIQDKAKNTWGWDGYLIPSGTAATEPNIGPMLTAAMGTDNAGASSKWIWTIASVQDWPTLSLTRHFNQIFQQAMWGAFVDKMAIKLAGGAQPMIHLDGRAMGYAFTGQSTLQQAVSAGNRILPAAADYYKYDVNSVIMVDADDGKSDLGYKVTTDHDTGSVTAVTDAGGGSCAFASAAHGLAIGDKVLHSGFADSNYNGYFELTAVTTDTYTATATYGATGTGTWHSAMTVVAADDDSAASITESQGDAVYPFVPSPTYVGSPISGVTGSMTADAASVLPVQSVDLELDNGHDVFEDEVMAENISDFAPGKVSLMLKIGLRIRQDQIYLLANPKAFGLVDWYFRTGPNKAGRRYEFDIDYGRAAFPDISIPKDGVGTATLTYRGYGSGATGPLTITHQ